MYALLSYFLTFLLEISHIWLISVITCDTKKRIQTCQVKRDAVNVIHIVNVTKIVLFITSLPSCLSLR